MSITNQFLNPPVKIGITIYFINILYIYIYIYIYIERERERERERVSMFAHLSVTKVLFSSPIYILRARYKVLILVCVKLETNVHWLGARTEAGVTATLRIQ